MRCFPPALPCLPWAVKSRGQSPRVRTCAAVGRLVGSLTRHLATSSRIALLKCFLLLSAAERG